MGLVGLNHPRLPNPDPVGAAMRPYLILRELTPRGRKTHRAGSAPSADAAGRMAGQLAYATTSIASEES
jgi:hypothetical protein